MVEQTPQQIANETQKEKAWDKLNEAVYQDCEDITKAHSEVVRGYDFNKGIDYEAMFKTYRHTGFQATNLGLAMEEINKMIHWRLSDEPIEEDEVEYYKDPEVRNKTRCTIYLGYTSNMASCGMREYIRYLCQHKMVDQIVTTTGGIEEDIMKCMAPCFMGDFSLKGAELRQKGWNRIGNMLVPTSNYTQLESWFLPIVNEMHEE